MTKRAPGEWRTLFNEHTQSGQSAAAFCRERGLCPRYFSKRRQQLLNSDPAPHPSKPAFAPVSVTPSSPTPFMELHWRDGMVIRIPASLPPAWLAELIHHLRR